MQERPDDAVDGVMHAEIELSVVRHIDTRDEEKMHVIPPSHVMSDDVDIMDHTHAHSPAQYTLMDDAVESEIATPVIVTVAPAHTITRSHHMLIYLLIIMNGVVRGCLGVAETYGTLLYFEVHQKVRGCVCAGCLVCAALSCCTCFHLSCCLLPMFARAG